MSNKRFTVYFLLIISCRFLAFIFSFSWCFCLATINFRTNLWFCIFSEIGFDCEDLFIPAARLVTGVLQRANLRLCIPLQFIGYNLSIQGSLKQTNLTVSSSVWWIMLTDCYVPSCHRHQEHIGHFSQLFWSPH